MASSSGAYLFVGRVGRRAAGIANGRFGDTGNLPYDFFHSPETASCQDSGLPGRRLYQASLNKRLEILPVAGLVHLLNRDELKRGRIYTVAQPAFIGRAVIEDMAEMRVSHF